MPNRNDIRVNFEALVVKWRSIKVQGPTKTKNWLCDGHFPQVGKLRVEPMQTHNENSGKQNLGWKWGSSYKLESSLQSVSERCRWTHGSIYVFGFQFNGLLWIEIVKCKAFSLENNEKRDEVDEHHADNKKWNHFIFNNLKISIFADLIGWTEFCKAA